MTPAEKNDLRALLQDWAQWMRSEDNTGRGYPTRAAGFCSGGASSPDAFEHLCEAKDRWEMSVVNRAVNDLPADGYGAVANEFLNSVWRYRGDPAVVLQRAMVNLLGKLRKNILWIGL